MTTNKPKSTCELCEELGSCFLLPENDAAYHQWIDSYQMNEDDILKIIPRNDEKRVSKYGLIKISKGHKALRDGDYKTALQHYMDVAKVSRYAYPAWTYAGICEYFLDNLDKAVECAENGTDPFVDFINHTGNRFWIHCKNALEKK